MVSLWAEAAASRRQETQSDLNKLTVALLGEIFANDGGIGTEARKSSDRLGAVLGALAGAAESAEDTELELPRIINCCIAGWVDIFLHDTFSATCHLFYCVGPAIPVA